MSTTPRVDALLAAFNRERSPGDVVALARDLERRVATLETRLRALLEAVDARLGNPNSGAVLLVLAQTCEEARAALAVPAAPCSCGANLPPWGSDHLPDCPHRPLDQDRFEDECRRAGLEPAPAPERDPDRLYCCVCGADIGDATDPYADPDCGPCLKREQERENERDAQDEFEHDYSTTGGALSD